MRALPTLALCFTLACKASDGSTDEDTDTTAAGDTDVVDTNVTDTDVAADTDVTEDTDVAAPTVADLLAAGATVQEVLDLGHTPLEIYQADNTLLNTIYGSLYQGGYIFYLNTTDGHGLVSDPGATRDSSPWSGVAWGCGAAEMPGADGTAIGDGPQNTIDIVTACPGTTTAASVCADLTLAGYSDWFLPSRDELALMYTNLKNNGNKGNLHANHYWSSSDWSTDSAYFVYFATGSAGQDAKTDPDRVRAVRAF